MPYDRKNDMWKGKEQQEGTLTGFFVQSKRKKPTEKNPFRLHNQ